MSIGRNCALRNTRRRVSANHSCSIPFWARFEIARHDEFGILRMDIVSPDRQVNIGSFLNP